MRKWLIIFICLSLVMGAYFSMQYLPHSRSLKFFEQKAQAKDQQDPKSETNQQILEAERILKKIHLYLMEVKSQYPELESYQDDFYKKGDILRQEFPGISFSYAIPVESSDWVDEYGYNPYRNFFYFSISISKSELILGPLSPIFIAHHKQLGFYLKFFFSGPKSSIDFANSMIDILSRISLEHGFDIEWPKLDQENNIEKGLGT